MAELLNGLNKPALLREKIRERKSERRFAIGDKEGNGDMLGVWLDDVVR